MINRWGLLICMRPIFFLNKSIDISFTGTKIEHEKIVDVFVNKQTTGVYESELNLFILCL